MKKIRKSTMLFAAIAIMLLALPLTAQAASKTPAIAKKKTIYVYQDGHWKEFHDLGLDKKSNPYQGSGLVKINNMKSGDKIISVRASNKKATAGVIGRDMYTYNAGNYSVLNYKKGKAVLVDTSGIKPGTKFTVTVKIKRGKKVYTSKCAVTVKKQPDIVSSFKIGSKNYASKINGWWLKTIKLHSGTYKVSIKTKSGIKLSNIIVEGTGAGAPLFIKNNSSIKLEAGKQYTITMEYDTKKAFVSHWMQAPNAGIMIIVN